MQTLVIGRDAGNQIVLNDKMVSRRHAQLSIFDNGQVQIKDLGSSNGTFVNGNKISESYLNAGDIVKCGNVFLNWADYFDQSVSQLQNYIQHPFTGSEMKKESGEASISSQFNLSNVFRYLTTRIFESGQLFSTAWDRKPSILFLKVTPVFLTMLITLIFYSKLNIGSYPFSIVVLAFCQYALCPFLTVFLLSSGKKVDIEKIGLASGVIGFLHFITSLCISISIAIYYNYIQENYYDFARHTSTYIFPLFLSLLTILVLVNIMISFVIFVYKYYISIGINRSVSIYLVITTFLINLFLQIISFYLIYLIVKDTF